MNMKTLCSTEIFLAGVSILLMLLILFASNVVAQPGDVAIKGYDTVAYFKDGKSMKGTETFTSSWHNMTWYFMSMENRDLFSKNPEKYAPQYDGWCAWAMTESRKAITDPEVWKIVDGKLYLQCSASALEKWIKDIPGNIKKADENWLNLNGRQ
jgi:YHS domain-containing protein